MTTPQWQTVRDGSLGGRRLVALFDVTAGTSEERAAMPTWASLVVFFGDDEAAGLPSPATSAQLDTLQAHLCVLLEGSGRSRWVGVITTGGRREFVVYTATPEELRGAARTLQAEFPALELQLTVMRDPDWTVFRQFVAERERG